MEKEDRRSIRTKKMIRSALLKLLEKKNFVDITITDITDTADINRGTFYLHYVDKYDLLNTIENEFLGIVIGFAKELTFDGVLEMDREGKILDVKKAIPFVEQLFQYLYDNPSIGKAVLGPNGNPNFSEKIMHSMSKAIFEDRYLINLDVSRLMVPRDVFVSYVMAAHLGSIKQWIEGGMKRKPSEIAYYLTKIFILGPFRVTGVNPLSDLKFKESPNPLAKGNS